MKKIFIWVSIILALTVGLAGLFVLSNRIVQISPTDLIVRIEAQGEKYDVTAWHNYYDGKDYFFLPAMVGNEDTESYLIVDGLRMIWIDGSIRLSGKLCGLKEYLEENSTFSLTAGNYSTQIVIMKSSQVPALFISTESGSLSYIESVKGNTETGLYCMADADGSLKAKGTIKGIKARGNATFNEDKKPYQISLEDRENLLGEKDRSQKKYILLANRQDQSLVRNKLLYDMAAEIGMDYTPVCDFVDLYINKEYRGSYLLSEKVEVDKHRIDIQVEKKDIDTGYLLTLDYEDRVEADKQYFSTPANHIYEIKEPENLPTRIKEKIVSDILTMEEAVAQKDLKAAKIDVESFAKKYLIEELSKNLDAMYASQYFYRERNGQLLYAGPVWDYDKTLGNSLIEKNRAVDFHDPQGVYAGITDPGMGGSFWEMFLEVPEFENQVKKEYASIRDIYESLGYEKLDAIRDYIYDSAYMDYYRWDTFENFKYGEEMDFDRYWGSELEIIRDFVTERKMFFDDLWLN